MTTPYLVLTDGTTTVTFLNGTTNPNYFIEAGNWAPSIAGQRKSPFGGIGMYGDVSEEINLIIKDTSAANCYTKLLTLTNLLDQAERWANDENATAVLLKFAPGGATTSSDTNPLQAVILGRDEGDETNGITLAPEWDSAANAFVLPIRMRFRRRGLWTLATTETASASANQPSAVVRTITLGSTATTPCFIDIKANNIPRNANQLVTPYLFWHKTAANLQVLEADSLTSAGFAEYSVVNDSANNARGTNVLRFQAGSTDLTAFIIRGPSAITTSCDKAMWYAAVKSSSSSVTWGIKITGYSANSSNVNNDPSEAVTYYTPTVTTPRIIPIGVTSNKKGLGGVALSCSSTSTSATLDIDYIIMVGVDDGDYGGVVGFSNLVPSNVYSSSPATHKVAVDVLYNPASDVDPNVQLRNTNSSATAGQSYSGKIPAMSTGQTINVVFAATLGSNWRVYSGALIDIGVDVTRYLGYLVPQ